MELMWGLTKLESSCDINSLEELTYIKYFLNLILKK
jgi:hypothetical protein